eukprot:jgi/Psemu1/33226/gm1.33226_g
MSLRDFMQGLLSDCAAAQRNDDSNNNSNNNSCSCSDVTNVRITIVSDNSSSTLYRADQSRYGLHASSHAADLPGIIDDFTVEVPLLPEPDRDPSGGARSALGTGPLFFKTRDHNSSRESEIVGGKDESSCWAFSDPLISPRTTLISQGTPPASLEGGGGDCDTTRTHQSSRKVRLGRSRLPPSTAATCMPPPLLD